MAKPIPDGYHSATRPLAGLDAAGARAVTPTTDRPHPSRASAGRLPE